MTQGSELGVSTERSFSAVEVDLSWSVNDELDALRSLWLHAEERLERERLARASDRRHMGDDNSRLRVELHDQRNEFHHARVDLHQANIDLHQANIDLHQANIDLHQANINLHQANINLQELLQSTSWRLTAPLRAIVGRIRGR